MFLSLFQWVIFVLVSLQLAKWKEKWSGKMSIRWKPEASSWFRLLKAGKIPFKQLLVSTMKLLIFMHCLGVRWQVAMWWEVVFLKLYSSKRKLIAYCLERDII